ncbi:MAG: hypothetical protein IJW16_00635 [Clostridia bacterium]|nr:hypothetical protein [Clostridia bacterium]
MKRMLSATLISLAFLLVHTPEASQTSDFLSDPAEIRFSDHLIITIAAMDPNLQYGDGVVRVNYTSGAYSLISCDGYGTDYDADGARIDTNRFGCDNEEWKDLIMRYLPIAES